MSLDVAVPGKGLDVGFVCNGWDPDPGGVETHTRGLARALASRGHRVHVLCLDGAEGKEPYSVETAVDDEGVEVRRMAYRYHDHGALADLARNRRAEDVVMAWMAETPCDVLHVHHLTGFGLGVLRAIDDLGAPLVMTLHDYWSLCPRGQMLHVDGSVCSAPEPERCAGCIGATWPHLLPSQGGRAEDPAGAALEGDAAAAGARTAYALECLALPQRLFTPSEAARSVYARAGLDPARIEVCENGVDVEGLAAEVARLRGGLERPAGVVRLGVLGSVLPSKGALELARAFVRADVEELWLDVHGNLPPYHGDPSYVDALRALADEHPRLTLHGEYAHAELPRLLAGLDGVAAPSRWEEVYGLTVREARAAGLPVLVSDAGDLPAVTRGGAAGRVVRRDDEDAWVEALRDFAADAAERERQGAAGAAPRSSAAMMLQIERGYVEVIREVTGLEPSLAFPVEGEAAPPPPGEAPRKRGLLGRLFGR